MRSRPRFTVAALVAALLGALLTVIPSTGISDRAVAAYAADFDPGFIVSDQQLYDGGAMTAAEVQAFIDSKHRGCTSGYTCLNTYTQDTVAIPADAYCAELSATTDESAASIIARVGAACDISQRFLVVLLEKEQSLVTHRAPNATRYKKATGFGCPDTSPCNTAFGGFYYQVYFAARQFNRYAALPNNYRHRAGQTNEVLFHPNASCGTAPVYIRNLATAGLYNYTPYQPNRAALANLYGEGDACSAYGNRNTWRIWMDWFGDPTLTLPTAKRLSGSDRYQTAVAVSHSEFGRGVPVVYLASGQKFPDGISAGAAAAHQGGPVLLTPSGSLPQSVRDEILRLQPRQVVIVGDVQSVSVEVEAAVRALVRDAGSAAAVAQEPATPSATEAALEPAPTATPSDEALESATPAPLPTSSPTPAADSVDDAVEAAPVPTSDADAAAPPQAAAQPTASSAAVLRLGGANRYETSRLIAEHAFDSAASAFVATGARFPDALAAGPAAARRNGPVLLVDGASGALDAATRATLQRLRIQWIGVVGDSAAVSDGIASGIASTGAQVTRYAGSDRYATAVRLASDFGDVSTAYVASGQSFPDALAGAAVAGAQGAPLLLTQQACMPEQTRSALIRSMPDDVFVLGGTPTIGATSARYVSCG